MPKYIKRESDFLKYKVWYSISFMSSVFHAMVLKK